GFDDNRQLGLTGAAAALPAWTEFMNAAVALRPELGGRTFACPEGIKFVEIDSEDGLLATLACPSRELIAVSDALPPNSECFRHSNLIEQNLAQVKTPEPHARVASEISARVALAQPQSRFKPTHTDTDKGGRRALVTDMR